jgi:hypothetical protein
MDPASADILERAARALVESERLIREAQQLRDLLAANQAILTASRLPSADAFREVRLVKRIRIG